MNALCLVAGGTGGHIFPAISFGRWVQEHHEAVRVSFICGSRLLEREIYRSQGVEPVVLPVSGSPFGVSDLSQKMRRWGEMGRSLGLFRRHVGSEAPNCCVLFGGYLSFIPLLVSTLSRIPVVVHEQNSVAGKVTRLAAKMGKTVASGWSECLPLTPTSYRMTGVPVRPVVPVDRERAWRAMGLAGNPPDRKMIGILGGSLMSEALIQLLGHMARDEEMGRYLFLVLGERPADGEEADNLLYLGRQWNMANLYSLLHMAITRGGASTLFELAAWGIPSVVVPWPQASDNHQENNARLFVRENGGALWSEGDSTELLKKKVLDVVQSTPPRRRTLTGEDESERLWRLISSHIGRERTERE